MDLILFTAPLRRHRQRCGDGGTDSLARPHFPIEPDRLQRQGGALQVRQPLAARHGTADGERGSCSVLTACAPAIPTA